jgi:hypothetical protein
MKVEFIECILCMTLWSHEGWEQLLRYTLDSLARSLGTYISVCNDHMMANSRVLVNYTIAATNQFDVYR